MKNIVIIGGGPGGYVAALRASQLGATVTLIEKEHLGGTCLNKGCIPTKSLYASAKRIQELQHSDTLGVCIPSYTVDFEKVQAHKNNTVNTLVSGIEKLLTARKVTVLKGVASFVDAHTLQVVQQNNEKTIVPYDDVIIATGSKPFVPPIEGMDRKRVLDSTQLLEMTEIPSSLAIIGGGIIGMEFASIFNQFGTKVTVLEKFSVLPSVDSEISKRFVAQIKKDIPIHAETDVLSIVENGELLDVHCKNAKGDFTISAAYVLACTGRVGNFDTLQIDDAHIDHDHKKIMVNRNFQTSQPHIYAIGDVNGLSQLAHSASDQGLQLVEYLLTGKTIVEKVIPGCIFTLPEIAAVGMTETTAKDKGLNFTKSKFMFGANGKALSMDEGNGFVKCLADEDTKKILGVHIMGPHASDLLQEATMAMEAGLSVEQISEIIHPHPTLSEAFWESVLMLNNTPVHSL